MSSACKFIYISPSLSLLLLGRFCRIEVDIDGEVRLDRMLGELEVGYYLIEGVGEGMKAT